MYPKIIDFMNILCLQVKESHSLYIHIYKSFVFIAGGPIEEK